MRERKSANLKSPVTKSILKLTKEYNTILFTKYSKLLVIIRNLIKLNCHIRKISEIPSAIISVKSYVVAQ